MRNYKKYIEEFSRVKSDLQKYSSEKLNFFCISHRNKISRHCDELIVEYENENNDEQRNSLLDKLKLNLTDINSNGKQADAIAKDVQMQSRH